MFTKLYHRFIRPIRNFFYYGWAMRKDTSWDYAGLYTAIHAKLSSLQKAIDNDPHHYWSPQTKRKLAYAKELSKRLSSAEFFVDDCAEYSVPVPDFEELFKSRDDRSQVYVRWSQYTRAKGKQEDYATKQLFEILKKEHRKWWC